MASEDLIASAIQMISTDDVEQNIRSAERLIRQVSEQDNASLVLLPENFLCFSAARYFDVARNIDAYIDHFAVLANELEVNLVLGSLPLPERPDGTILEGKLRTASIVIDQQGKVLARYDKRHLFDVDVTDGQGAYRESNEFEAGEAIVVASLGELNIGLSICYDLRFPSHYQKLRDSGANVLLVPAAFTHVTGQAHWETLLKARAIENQCYVIAANQGGDHSPRRSTWGHSMIIDPWGRVLTTLEKGEGFCSEAINFALIEELRQKMPVQAHRLKAEHD